MRDNGSVAIDFNSGQLDDALNSLTALDLGNGRVAGISYNSEASVDQQRIRLNLESVKRTSEEKRLARRYAEQLTTLAARIGSLGREIADLERQRRAAAAEVDGLIGGLALDVSLDPSPDPGLR